MGRFTSLLFSLSSITLLTACAGSRSLQAQSGKEAADPNVCTSTLGNHRLQWTFQDDVSELGLIGAVGNNKLPAKFQVFATDPQALKLYLTATNSADQTSPIALPLSEGVGCQVFEVGTSGTMSPELAAKFPNLISLKGQAPNQAGADARIDFDGEKMEAQLNWEGQTYIISPWPSSSGTIYYLVYKKEDSGREKIPRKPN